MSKYTKQISTHVDPDFWTQLLARLDGWPEEAKVQARVARYALDELEADEREFPRLKPSHPPAPSGSQRVQVGALSIEEEYIWDDLAAGWARGNHSEMLRVALGRLAWWVDPARLSE